MHSFVVFVSLLILGVALVVGAPQQKSGVQKIPVTHRTGIPTKKNLEKIQEIHALASPVPVPADYLIPKVVVDFDVGTPSNSMNKKQ